MKEITKTIDSGWKIYYSKNSACRDWADSVTTAGELKKKSVESIPAEVPGCFVLDMYKAGKIPDPFFADNLIKLQYLETMHLWYSVVFDYDFSEGESLLFEGIDTIADVYLDGEHLLRTENMFLPYKAKCKGKGKHELLVHITPAVIEARKYKAAAASNALWYNYQCLYIRKAAFSFGWDILPRVASGGIWKPVHVIKEKVDSINDVFVYTLFTNPEANRAKIRIYYDLTVSDDMIQNYLFRFTGKCGDSEFCEEIVPWGNQYGRLAFVIENAKLWWPRGYGEPNLYDCKAELIYDGKVVDTYEMKYGIRTVELDRTESIKDGEGKFLFKVNGVPVFWRGVNWSPLSPFPSENEKKLPEGLNYLWETGSNCVRMWGGGIYEDDSFFDFCDSHGIMVWQDFMMACAVYPQDKTFADKLEEEVVYQICRLRNHASLMLWSGDNECDCTYNTWGGVVRDPNENVITRELLPRLCRMHDFSRPYLPSSPYISKECYTEGLHSPEEHLWGDRPHFQSDYYTKSECKFVSEIGYPGAVSPESAKKFIGKEYLYPLLREDGEANDHWMAHSTETQITDLESPYKYRMKLLVNKVNEYVKEKPKTYEEFSEISQIVQAEAVKYFIELFRGNKWRRTGIIYWNLADGWPLSSEAVVDSYGDKKLAFDYMRIAYEPLYVMLKGQENELDLIASNDTLQDEKVSYTITDVTSGAVLAKGEGISKANDNTVFGKVSLPSDKTFAKIEWEYDGKKVVSHYFGGVFNLTIDEYLECLEKCGLAY